MYAALRSPLAGACPDLHLFPILLPLPPGAGYPPPAAGHALVASAMAPDSRGSVHWPPPDPQEAPLIDPGFLRDGRDLDRLEAGLLMIREAAASAAFSPAQTTEAWPGADVRTSAGLRDYIRRTVDSYHHPVGTCRMGPDAGAVVDLELRVRGITGLRVADASVMPAIPNAHPAATVLAIAERAADLIAGRSGTRTQTRRQPIAAGRTSLSPQQHRWSIGARKGRREDRAQSSPRRAPRSAAPRLAVRLRQPAPPRPAGPVHITAVAGSCDPAHILLKRSV